MYDPLCGMVHVKDPLVLIGENNYQTALFSAKSIKDSTNKLLSN